MTHHQRDRVNKEDADCLKLLADAPATGLPPSLVLLRPAAGSPSPSSSAAIWPGNTDSAPSAHQLSVPAAPADPAARHTAVPSRCSSCRKRLGPAAGFRCRCGVLLCGVHRYSDRHACTFDYKAEAREAIARDNPVFKAPKMLKI